jgi:hypothetical protein
VLCQGRVRQPENEYIDIKPSPFMASTPISKNNPPVSPTKACPCPAGNGNEKKTLAVVCGAQNNIEAVRTPKLKALGGCTKRSLPKGLQIIVKKSGFARKRDQLKRKGRMFWNGLPVIKKHFPAATKEWNNSVYAYNSKRTILLSAIDKIVKKLIKSYFNSYFLSSPKIRELSVLNKVYVSKPEIKHTNSKVIITIYKYGSSIKNKNKAEQIKINDWQNKHITKLSEDLTSLSDEKDTTINEKDNLNYFSDLISEFYGSRVELRIIDLKYLHLNTSILVEYLSNKLTNRKRVLRKYRILLRQIKLPVYNKHTHKHLTKNNRLKELSLLNNISNLSVEDLKINKLENEGLLTNMALSSIKYKAVIGARFEIGGRLTRRNIASKSVFKFGQVGTLKNIDASYKGMPVVTLRGNHRPNLDFSSYKTRTRNGAFNVKG